MESSTSLDCANSEAEPNHRVRVNALDESEVYSGVMPGREMHNAAHWVKASGDCRLQKSDYRGKNLLPQQLDQT